MHYIFPFAYFFIFIADLGMAVFVLVLNRKSRLNILFALYSIGTALCAFCYTVLFLSSARESAFFWIWLSSIISSVTIPISIHFFLVLTEKTKLLKKAWIYLLLYLPAVFLLIMGIRGERFVKDMVAAPLGWLLVPADDLAVLIAFLYFTVGGLAAILQILFWRNSRSSNLMRKKQSNAIIIGLFLTISSVVLFEYLLPRILNTPLPSSSYVSAFFYSTSIFYAIVKYRLMVLNPQSAAENILMTMSDALLLISSENRIVSANTEVAKIFHRKQSDLIGMDVSTLFSQISLFQKETLEQLYKNGPIRNSEIEIRFSSRIIPLSVSVSPITDRNKLWIGNVAILRDITERKEAEAKLSEQNRLLDQQNKQMMNDLKIGQSIQQSLLGDVPKKLGNFLFFLEQHPFAEVSGDFYDFFEVSDRKVFFLLGDVSGHGVSAALITTMAKTIFNAVVRGDLSTAEVCRAFNRKLTTELRDSNFYITGIVLKIDLEDNTIEYTNAGHTLPYFYKKEANAVEKLSTENMMLGLIDANYSNKFISLKKGDKLILYTDGLYEVKNGRDEQYLNYFDKDFLETACGETKNLSRVLFEKAKTFAEGNTFDDDVTILSIEW
jgi:PAS domain S-box-containing protein